MKKITCNIQWYTICMLAVSFLSKAISAYPHTFAEIKNSENIKSLVKKLNLNGT